MNFTQFNLSLTPQNLKHYFNCHTSVSFADMKMEFSEFNSKKYKKNFPDWKFYPIEAV